jgi:Ca2+-binding EF-hand superfamily protein
MKYPTFILTICALAILPLGAEEAKKPGGGKAGKGDGSIFKQMDKDGDRAISKEEAGERWEKLAKLDKNTDGRVTLQEMAAARPGGEGTPGKGKGPGKGGPGKGNPDDRFKNADKNGDGKLTKDEVPEQAWNFLSRLDKNEDGAISEEEAKAGRPPGGAGGSNGPGKGGPGGGEFLKRADKNGDGNISKDEVPEQAWERVSRMDKNKDDKISKEEMAAATAMMRAAGKGKGKDGKGKGKEKGKGGPPTGGPGAVFGRYDENKDGKIGEDEVPAEMWSRLRKADTDADGLVSKSELEKVYSEREKYAPKGEVKKEDTPRKKRPELEKPSA